MAAKYKVDGSGNRWYVWRWGVSGEFWSIISKSYITKRSAKAAMKREMKSTGHL
jgi:hypothetical protein